MSAVETLLSVVNRVADIASSIKRKLAFFVFLGLVASGFLAFSAFSADSQLWWNLVKCALLMLPALVWLFIWSVLAQLQEAPVLVSQLVADDQGLFNNVENLSLSEPNGLSGVFATLREFRQEDGLSIIFETMSGVTLLANPAFAIFAFANWAILFIFTIVAAMIALF